MVFESSSQNRKAVEIERDSRSHTKSNIKYPTLVPIFEKMEKVGFFFFSETRVRIEKLSKSSEITRPPLKSLSKVDPHYFLDLKKMKKKSEKSCDCCGWWGGLFCKIFLGPKMALFTKGKKTNNLTPLKTEQFHHNFFLTPVWHGDLDHSDLQNDQG